MTKLKRNLLVFVVTLTLSMLLSITVFAEEVVINNETGNYTVSEGTVYWEISTNYGSGKHFTISDDNPYTSVHDGKLPVRVNGYSILDSNGIPTEAVYDSEAQTFNISASTSNNVMLHVAESTDTGFRLGWIKFNELVSLNEQVSTEKTSNDKVDAKKETKKAETKPVQKAPTYQISDNEANWLGSSEKKDVEKIANTLALSVEEDYSAGKDSYILADVSSSMESFQADVLEKLNGARGKKYIFANSMQEFEDGTNIADYNIGGGTNISNALNQINPDNDGHIYILSDLCDGNILNHIKKNEDFHGEITIIYYDSAFFAPRFFMHKLRRSYPNATITGF